MPPRAGVHAVRSSRVEVRDVRLPGREDRPGHPLLDQDPQRGQVDGRLRQPERGGAPAEPDLEVSQAPPDLGAPVVQRGERQDRVVEGLSDAGPSVRAATEHVACPEAGQHIGRRVGEVAAQRRSEVPRGVGQRAQLGVGAIALGRGPGVPVPERGRGRVRRQVAGERVDPGGLVEVGVDDQSAAAHRSEPARPPSSPFTPVPRPAHVPSGAFTPGRRPRPRRGPGSRSRPGAARPCASRPGRG